MNHQPDRRKRRLFDKRYVGAERRRTYVLSCILFWSILMFLFLSRYLFSAVEVLGPSMHPTLDQGDRRFLKRWSYYFRDPSRGDIVALDRLRDGDLVVKRVIALPGETIQIKDSTIFIDDTPLTEPYLGEGVSTYPHVFGHSPITLRGGQYFVIGDNRNNSEDSRAYGPVDRRAIQGVISP